MGSFNSCSSSPHRSSTGMTVSVASALLTVHLSNIAKAHDAMVQVEVAAQLCQRVLQKSDQYGSDAALLGVREILIALDTTLSTL